MGLMDPPDHSEYEEIACPTCDRLIYGSDRVESGCVTCMETCVDCGDNYPKAQFVTVNEEFPDKKRMCLQCAIARRAEFELAIKHVESEEGYEEALRLMTEDRDYLLRTVRQYQLQSIMHQTELVALRSELKTMRMTALGVALGAK